MSRTDTQRYAQLLDLDIDPHLVRITAGDKADLTWYDTYDGDSSQPAVAWVEYATPEGGYTDEAFDLDNLRHFFTTLGDNPDVDQDYGITVTLSPIWLHWTDNASLAA